MNRALESTLPNAAPITFSQKIKQATASKHQALESHPALAILMQSHVTHADYGVYLTTMLEVLKTYEKLILPEFASLDLPFSNEHSSGDICEDLNQLQLTNIADAKIPRYEIDRSFISVPFALGFMYVIEGSKLGGKVIYKHLNKTIGITQDFGGKYVSDKDNPTGIKWKNFLSFMEMHTNEYRCDEEIIEGAIFAFDSIHKYFVLRTALA